MLKLKSVSITEYELDQGSFSPPTSATRLDPPDPGYISINISALELEISYEVYLKIKVGTEVEFDLNDELELNYKGNDFSAHVRGIAEGTITEVEEMKREDFCEDNLCLVNVKVDAYADNVG